MQATKIERKQDRRVLNYVAKREEMDAYNGLVKKSNLYLSRFNGQ